MVCASCSGSPLNRWGRRAASSRQPRSQADGTQVALAAALSNAAVPVAAPSSSVKIRLRFVRAGWRCSRSRMTQTCGPPGAISGSCHAGAGFGAARAASTVRPDERAGSALPARAARRSPRRAQWRVEQPGGQQPLASVATASLARARVRARDAEVGCGHAWAWGARVSQTGRCGWLLPDACRERAPEVPSLGGDE